MITVKCSESYAKVASVKTRQSETGEFGRWVGVIPLKGELGIKAKKGKDMERMMT